MNAQDSSHINIIKTFGVLLFFIIAAVAVTYYAHRNDVKQVWQEDVIDCYTFSTTCLSILNYSDGYFPNPAINCTSLKIPHGTTFEHLTNQLLRFSNLTVEEIEYSWYKQLKSECITYNETTWKNRTLKWKHREPGYVLNQEINVTWVLPNGSMASINQRTT